MDGASQQQSRAPKLDEIYEQLLRDQPNNEFLWQRIIERSRRGRVREREPGEDDE